MNVIHSINFNSTKIHLDLIVQFEFVIIHFHHSEMWNFAIKTLKIEHYGCLLNLYQDNYDQGLLMMMISYEYSMQYLSLIWWILIMKHFLVPIINYAFTYVILIIKEVIILQLEIMHGIITVIIKHVALLLQKKRKCSILDSLGTMDISVERNGKFEQH